ncbi:hypothetical protein ABEB36_015343 [Hypothenemus hampei]|uniref:Uncharacterized protein n=1 Tax=Hypothenemus hampei TaxID=57062 RepID=A0ABD1DZX6_HYPHA
MLKQSNSKFPKIGIGQNVLIRIPDVDRGRVATRNILAVVLTEKDDLYQLETATVTCQCYPIVRPTLAPHKQIFFFVVFHNFGAKNSLSVRVKPFVTMMV